MLYKFTGSGKDSFLRNRNLRHDHAPFSSLTRRVIMLASLTRRVSMLASLTLRVSMLASLTRRVSMLASLTLRVAFVGTVLAFAGVPAHACTSILVTRGASADGSVIITYACDLAGQYSELPLVPAADHKPGEMIDILPRSPIDKRPPAKIPQVPHTYKVLGFMNEHQVAIAETTFGGREQLNNPLGLIDCEPMMNFALQRARTAREAIKVMTGLADKYGYGEAGESFSIGDTQEAWILEMVGAGPNPPAGHGAIWAAVRVPDGQISCIANASRIGEIARDDPDNCLYSENVQSFAERHGWYDPKSGQPFRFCDAYFGPTPLSRRICDARVWSVFRRAAPSQHLAPDYHRSKPGAVPYPLWLPPDSKLTVADVFALMRDHFEGTEFDMTQGLDAGPYGLPNRWRPLVWKLDGADYIWERPISTQQTAFSFVSQSRAWLPDEIGGVYWYGVDDTFTNCYMPFYCCVESLPKSFTGGSNRKFTLESAWWTFNIVSNYAYLKWSMMTPEIRACQKDCETNFLALQPVVEKTALELHKTSPNLMTRYLTDYSTMHAEQTVARWRELYEHLIVKYNDGYVRDVNGQYPEVGYPEAWLRRVVKERPEQFKVPVEKPQEAPQVKK